jgi:hypothetical protein
MAAETDASRLPEAERRDHGRGQRRLDQRESHASEDLQWLYSPTMDDDIAEWIRTQT